MKDYQLLIIWVMLLAPAVAGSFPGSGYPSGTIRSDVQVSLPGVGASVFCGVGLAGGLLGVAVGTFFLIKGNKCN